MRAQLGPFRPVHVREGDPYEISRGHPVRVTPARARRGKEHLVGSLPLATDPAVTEVGIDVGYELNEHTLRAPDIAVGNVPDVPGWVKGAPWLAVEYADRHTDEDDLETKIAELLEAGTRVVWVVRLVGPRRVDVHSKGVAPRVVPGGGMLEAPGILANAVPVDALFDEARAKQVALRNLLAKYERDFVDAARQEGRVRGARGAVEALCSVLLLELDDAKRARLAAMSADELDELVAHLAAHRAWP